MSTENQQADLDAAFAGGFNDEQTDPEPAANEPASAPAAVDEQPEPQAAGAAPDPQPELSAAEIRAQLAELQSLRQAVQVLPQLTERLRKAEGRLGDLNARVPVPPPPSPPRLEKVEKVREELPEVVEAMEEFFQSRVAAKEPEQAAAPADPAPSVLDAEQPDWEAKVRSAEFDQWLGTQDPAYRQKVMTTNSEAVMLAAIARFDVQSEAKRRAQEAAMRAAQTRNARAAAAVVPTGAGRRAPTEPSLEAAFAAGFAGER